MSRKLHAIRGNNSFCGPAAIASVLGLTTDHAARVLRSISGDRRVTGVYPVHFVQALRNLGCEVEHLTVPAVHRMPVRQWLEVHASLFAEKHIVIDFADHYGVVLGGQYQCGISMGPVEWATQLIPSERGEVTEYVVVHQVPEAVPAEATGASRKVLQRARGLAVRNGIEITRECVDVYRVTCPDLEDDDPHEGRQEAYSAREVLEMVEDYVYCLRNGYLEAVTDERLWLGHQKGAGLTNSCYL